MKPSKRYHVLYVCIYVRNETVKTVTWTRTSQTGAEAERIHLCIDIGMIGHPLRQLRGYWYLGVCTPYVFEALSCHATVRCLRFRYFPKAYWYVFLSLLFPALPLSTCSLHPPSPPRFLPPTLQLNCWPVRWSFTNSPTRRMRVRPSSTTPSQPCNSWSTKDASKLS